MSKYKLITVLHMSIYYRLMTYGIKENLKFPVFLQIVETIVK